MHNHESRVREFMRLAGQHLPASPTLPTEEVCHLRATLILEEALEKIDALGFVVKVKSLYNDCTIERDVVECIPHGDPPDLIEIVKESADTIVVSTGTLISCGVPVESVLELVDESNLAKYSGDYKIRPDGKVIKPTGWKKPDIASLLQNQPVRES